MRWFPRPILSLVIRCANCEIRYEHTFWHAYQRKHDDRQDKLTVVKALRRLLDAPGILSQSGVCKDTHDE